VVTSARKPVILLLWATLNRQPSPDRLDTQSAERLEQGGIPDHQLGVQIGSGKPGQVIDGAPTHEFDGTTGFGR
jgi:hypothetical protein